MISDPVFQAILLPITIGYFLFLLEFADKKKEKRKNIIVPFKEILIAVIALDFSVLLPELLSLDRGINIDTKPLMIYALVFIIHFAVLIYYKKSNWLQKQHDAKSTKERNLSLIYNSYVGIATLATNAVTMEVIIYSSRWL